MSKAKPAQSVHFQRDALRSLPAWEDAWATPDGLVGLDGRADLWWIGDGRVLWVPGPWASVHVRPGGLSAWGGGRGLDLDAGAEPRIADGWGVPNGRILRTDRWEVPGAPLPEGALRAAGLWPAGDGRAVWWWDHGVIYARSDAGIRPICTADELPALVTGPDGNAVLDGRWWLRADGRRRPLAVPVDPHRWLKVSPDAVWGVDGAEAVRFGPDGRVTARLPGVPIGEDRLLPYPTDDREVAFDGRHLAGLAPGLWDLATGTATQVTLPDGPVVPVRGGFLALDWQTGAGAVFGTDGAVRAAVAVPVADGLGSLRPAGDGAEATDTEGRCWSVAPDGSLRPLARPSPRPRRQPHGAPVPADGGAEVAGARWAWRRDGLLLRL